MNPNKLIGDLIAKIHNQRFLFGSVGIIVVASIASFEVIAAIIILASVVTIIGLDIIASSRVRSGQIGLTLVLEFPKSVELEDINLRSGECRASSSRNPGGPVSHRLTPHRDGGGQGWLCPMPTGISAGDVVEFTFLDSTGGSWATDPRTPELLYPKIGVRRIVEDDR